MKREEGGRDSVFWDKKKRETATLNGMAVIVVIVNALW